MKEFKLYRWWKGGTWYKYEMSGWIPGCYGSFWTQKYENNCRVRLVKTEDYEK